MSVVRGTPYRILNISTSPIMILQVNPNRSGLFIEAASTNAGNVAISFNDPNLTISGDKAGILLGASDQYVESPPDANSGSVWAVSTNGTEDILIREDYSE